MLTSSVAIALALISTAWSQEGQLCSPEECPDLWVRVQDGGWWCRIVHGDTIPADRFSAAFILEMAQDSTSLIDYTVTEFKRNGALLWLPSWKLDRKVNASEEMLAANSQTELFPLVAGDVLSFYREINWVSIMPDGRTMENRTDNYYSRDTLDYVVELVRRSDLSRIVLLDSLGALPNLQPAIPRLYGMRPMAALVSYTVPPEIADGDSAFIRLVPHARGDGAYYFTRTDDITVGVSRCLQQPFWQALNDYIGLRGNGSDTSPKMELGELQRLDEASAGGELRIVSISGDRVELGFSTKANAGKMAVAVFDATGAVVFYPYAGPASTTERTVTYQFPRSGAYFIGLSYDGALVQTKKIIITK